uniref:Uncharacterized protein n=1 Tax=Panagrolaimus sp. JU765 TaxID=591449 RepID=A0AC34RFH5_9BILA
MATTFTNTYETSKNIVLLIIGSCLCWIYGLGNFLCWNVFYVDISLLSTVSYCISIVDFICIIILWRINRYAKKIRSSSVLALTTRYQIDENVRMTTYIAPFLLLGTVFTIIAGLGSEYLEHLFGVTSKHPCSALIYYLLLNLMVLIIYIYETCMKFGIEEKLEDLLRETRIWKHYKFHKNPLITDEGNHYFQELRKVWNS